MSKETIIDRRPGRNNKVISLVKVHIYLKNNKEPKIYELEKDLHCLQVCFSFDYLVWAYLSRDNANNEKGQLVFFLTTTPKIIKIFNDIEKIDLEVCEVYNKTHQPIKNGRREIATIYDRNLGWL